MMVNVSPFFPFYSHDFMVCVPVHLEMLNNHTGTSLRTSWYMQQQRLPLSAANCFDSWLWVALHPFHRTIDSGLSLTLVVSHCAHRNSDNLIWLNLEIFNLFLFLWLFLIIILAVSEWKSFCSTTCSMTTRTTQLQIFVENSWDPC